jgi:predicted SAM-dependent methyltransferase
MRRRQLCQQMPSLLKTTYEKEKLNLILCSSKVPHLFTAQESYFSSACCDIRACTVVLVRSAPDLQESFQHYAHIQKKKKKTVY